MSFTKIPTTLQDCFLIEPQIFGDARGFFMETYSTIEFEKIGIHVNFVQDNHSKSKKWVLRGLHFQSRKPQAKLVRVSAWSVYDVVVDLRKESPTFGKWEGFLLSVENKRMLLVPRGFAHGFLTLEDSTEFLYKCDDIYDPGFEWGVIWNDPTLAIDWEKYQKEYTIDELEISPKDQKNSLFQDLKKWEIFPLNKQTKWNLWNHKKQKLDKNIRSIFVKEWDLWWTHLGVNIGKEMDGKSEVFTRPCIIYKKLTTDQFLVIPASTKHKQGSWYVPYIHGGIHSIACLQQIRVVDARRLRNRIGQLDMTDMDRISAWFYSLYAKNCTPSFDGGGRWESPKM